MLPVSRIQFSSRKEAQEFVRWEKVVEHILDSTDFSKIEAIIVSSAKHPNVRSHPEELSQFFETHMMNLLSESGQR